MEPSGENRALSLSIEIATTILTVQCRVIKYIGSSIECKLQGLHVVISAHYCYVSNIYENVFGYVCYLNNKKIYEGNYANGNFLDLRYVKHARTRCYVRQYWKGSTISSLVSFQTFKITTSFFLTETFHLVGFIRSSR
mgnify:CR=1 FL=1